MPKLSDETLADAADALTRGDAAGAVQVCTVAGASFFAEPSFTADIDCVLNLTPQVLSDCPPHILQPLRIAAGLMMLTGGSSIRRFIAIDGDYSYRYDASSVAHLLVSHAAYLRQRSSMVDIGITKFKTLGSGLPEECATCRKTSRHRFTIETLPELPLVDCTCPGGCMCILITAS